MSSSAAGRASAGRSGGAGAGGAGSAAPAVDASTPPDPETPVADAAVDEPSDQPTKQPPRQLDPQANAVDKRAPPPGDLEAGCNVGSSHSQAQLGLICLAAISFIARRRRKPRS